MKIVSLVQAVTLAWLTFFPLVSRAESDLAEPPVGVRQALDEYFTALGSEKWDAYRNTFHINGHPDARIRDRWADHDAKVSLTKLELLHQEQDLIVARVFTDIHWLDYKPRFTSEETCIIILRKEHQKDKSLWKLWSVAQLDVRKKG
jgi:hypothetical protein